MAHSKTKYNRGQMFSYLGAHALLVETICHAGNWRRIYLRLKKKLCPVSRNRKKTTKALSDVANIRGLFLKQKIMNSK